MKRLINLSVAMLILSFFATTAFAQTTNTVQNANQNQFNNMVQSTTGQFGNSQGVNWVDADGDGICDNYGTVNQGSGSGHGYGLKDGSGAGTRPQDGTGFGRINNAGANGTGTGTGIADCDGTGPKGSARRGGRNQ